MSTNHLGKSGRRSTCASTAAMASVANRTPVVQIVVTSSTTGWRPFPVMEAAHRSTASTESSRSPFQWFSSTPQQRSTGLSVLW